MEDSEEESYSASASASRVGRDEAQEKINMDAKRDHEVREEKIEKDRLWREQMAQASREREEEAMDREIQRRVRREESRERHNQRINQGESQNDAVIYDSRDARGTFAGQPQPPQDQVEDTEMQREDAFLARRQLEEARQRMEEVEAAEEEVQREREQREIDRDAERATGDGDTNQVADCSYDGHWEDQEYGVKPWH